MKKTLFYIVLIFPILGCDVEQTQSDEDDGALSDSYIVREDLPTVGVKLIWDLEGEYLMLREEGSKVFYEEPCEFRDADVKIAESAEGSGAWEIYRLGDWYPIQRAEEKNGGIYITADTETEEVFMFLPAENELLWNFAMMGTRNSSPIVRVEALDRIEINPCTDAAAIMKDLPTTWYQLTLLDGDNVIYEYCEEAPGGITIGEIGESIDFWSGSDPYEILSMSKANSRVTIVYMTSFREDTLYMHNFYGTLVRFGEGTGEDDLYVSEGSKGRYRVVEEECDD